MIFKELLKECDCKRIAEIWESNKADYEPKEDLSKVTEELGEFVANLNKLTANPETKNKVLFVSKAFDYFEDYEYLDATMYEADDFNEAIEKSKDILLPDISGNLTTAELDEVVENLRIVAPESAYAFDLTNWEDVLGYQVISNNVEKYGKQEYIATVLDEMSFHGYSRESQQEMKEEIEESARDVKEHPEHTVPVEKVLGLDWNKDERSQEEIDAEKHHGVLQQAKYYKELIENLREVPSKINF